MSHLKLKQAGVNGVVLDRIRLSDGVDENESEWGHEGDGTLAIAPEQVKPRLSEPKKYQVIMMNDDYTPMDFVVHVLENFFNLGREKSTQVMLAVHTEGRAVCGTYSRDVAESKAEQVNLYSRQNEHPLLCDIEVQEFGESDEGRES